MSSTAIRNKFKKGFLELIILSLLKDQDLYGYEMVKLFSERCDGALSVLESTLYPTLYKLEEKGLISHQRIKTSVRQHKVFYHLEEPGRKRLEEILPEYHITMKAVNQILGFE